MKAKPIKQCGTPGYPTRRELLAGAAGFVLASMVEAVPGLPGESKNAIQTVVAPIFNHGEGRGAAGCVVVSPPAFLSEEEAMQVIREELGKHGVKLKSGTVLRNVRVPQIMDAVEEYSKKMKEKQSPEKFLKDLDKPRPLKLDGKDSKKKIAVEFISEHDYLNMDMSGVTGSVQHYDFKKLLGKLRKQIEKEGKEQLWVGLFYDPMVEFSFLKSTKKAKDLLRKQAQDFVAWLKKEKAI